MRLTPHLYDRRFVCFLHTKGINEISLGVSLDLQSPNFELHLPFCFFKIGWQAVTSRYHCPNRVWGLFYSGWKWGDRF